MGARLSLLAPSAPTIAISSYVDILDNIQYVEIINNSRFLKTIKAIDLNNGDAIVIKIHIKPNNYNLNLTNITELLVKESSLLSQTNYYLPYQQLIETDRAGYLIRQSIKINLYDRLSIRPFLEPIEKNFIVFQLLKIMDNLHNELKIYHGDLKLENIMVSSSNWIMLTDFSNFIKPVFIPEDNPAQYSFYFDTSDRRVCNLAPERFYNSSIGLVPPLVQNFDDNNNFNGINQLTPEMDLFSLGCIIGELYLDGEPLFTLSGLFKYMKNEYLPELSAIENPLIKEIILKLISFDPNSRIKSHEILSKYRGSLFYHCFYDFLYDFIKKLNNNSLFEVPNDNDNITSSDLRIDFIYDNFHNIIKGLEFQYTDEEPVVSDGMFLNLGGMPKNYQIKPSSEFIHKDNSSLIILNFIFSLMSTLKQPSSKIKACELIVALSERINDECKLDRALPYLCQLIDEYIASTSIRRFTVESSTLEDTYEGNGNEYSSKVIVIALDSIVTLLNSCSYITPLNVLMFPEYLLPKLSKLITSESINNKGKQLIKIKIGSCLPKLAQISYRFWQMTKSFKSTTNHEPFLIPLDMLYMVFEDLTIILLTDSNPKIRASLVNNIEPLCRFFGVDKTDDIILPHLITYLNDAHADLRFSFLDSILKIGPFVGVLSFEQYLLPLLIQTLSDVEQLVVLKVLEVFVKFVDDKLISPMSQFNALSIYKELLVNTTNLLLHPNEWIRQSVLNLILAINGNISEADKFCFLYPEIKRYLSYDVTDINWDTLYPCLTRPLTKLAYQVLITWCNASCHSEKSIFWKDQNMVVSPGKLTSFTKDLGKSVFLKYTANDYKSTPLSHEDKQWFLKLRGVGLEEKDFWKVFGLRSYVLQVCKGISKPEEITQFSDLGVNITPRNIFYDINYKTEPIATVSKGSRMNISKDTNLEQTTKNQRSMSNSLVLPNITRVSASIQTSEENVFGELDNDPHHHSKKKPNDEVNGFNHKVISSDNEKVIIANSKHSYVGYNPFILHYLETVEFDLSLDSFSEFGNPIKIHNNVQSSDWAPTTKCISRINTNSSGNNDDIDSINCIAINPTSEFFITGSEQGILKVWDTQKLEKNIMFKNPSLITHLKSPILKICFMESRNVAAVSCKNGKIFLFRVDFTRGKNKKIVKYSKLGLIRKYHLDNQYATTMTFNFDNSRTLLVVTTSRSQIIGFNIITMESEFNLQNPLNHGILTSLIINALKGWLVVGTSSGRFCLWDIRFCVVVKVWRISNDSKQLSPIKQMILLPSDYLRESHSGDRSYFAVIGGTLDSDITIWELPSLECRDVLCSYTETPKVKNYYSEEIKTNDISDMLDELTLEFDNDIIGKNDNNHNNNNCMVLYRHITGDFLVNSIESNRLILWKLGDFENSVSNGYSFTRSIINQQGLTNEKIKQGLDESLNQDIINDIGVVSVPYEMIITVDRTGFISIFI